MDARSWQEVKPVIAEVAALPAEPIGVGFDPRRIGDFAERRYQR